MEEDDLNEDIDPSEALNDVDAINTLIDRKRDIAFIVEKSNTPENWKRVQQMIKDNDIKIMFVKGNPYNAYIAYLPGSENKATQLKDLAEKYGGYLASNATAEDARKIGKLLGYKEDKIEQYIKDRNIDESLRDWFKKEDWVRIDTQGNITGPCGTMKKGKATTRCLPRAKANRLTKAERAATARKKVAGSKKGKQFVPNTEKAKVKLNK
jgi:translation initiation factor 1 (eIF-1/SUI1)